MSELSLSPWLSPEEAAMYLRTTHRALMRLVRLKRVPSHPLHNGRRKSRHRFLPEELNAYLGRST